MSVFAASLAAPAWAGAQTRVILRDRPTQVLEVGGGVGDFTEGLDAATDPGAAWDVRAIFGTRSLIGFEIAYIGALNDLNTTLPGTRDASLLTTGGEGMLRLNLTTSDIQPFLAGGFGVHNYSIIDRSDIGNNPDAAEFRDSTDLAVPAAVGVQAYINESVTVGGRVTYRYIFDDDVRADTSAADMQSWAATARLGVTF